MEWLEYNEDNYLSIKELCDKYNISDNDIEALD